MQLLKFDRILILVFVMCSFRSRGQEVVNTVAIEKINAGLYRIQYKLNPAAESEITKIVLKILRRREGNIDEIFSKELAVNSGLQDQRVHNYNWKPGSGELKTGDELQAKIVLSYKPSLAKQKANLLNKTPYADAGNSLEVELPITKPIALNGSKSHDEDGEIISAEWKQIAGPTNLTLLRKDSLIAYANGEFKAGTYAFELSVKDNHGATAISRTVLNVKSAPFVIHTTPATALLKKDTVVRRVAPIVQNTASFKTSAKLKGGPSNAALNLLMPGLGHYFVSGDHNGGNRKAASFILTAVYAGSIGGAFYFNQKSSSQYKKYNELASYREYQKDANGLIIGVRGGNEQEADQYLSSARSAHRNSLICLGVGGGVLVGDLIYTLVKGSKNRREWKNENTSFRPNLFVSSDGAQTIAGVQFKF